MELLM